MDGREHVVDIPPHRAADTDSPMCKENKYDKEKKACAAPHRASCLSAKAEGFNTFWASKDGWVVVKLRKETGITANS